ncbi:hypothetical protein DFS34DRAFT_295933 [Phlyctochytrium arcticum]|nr:hypothetical protein DFS34DRAFT_295933 [Phlyctochytrium arcticum]
MSQCPKITEDGWIRAAPFLKNLRSLYLENGPDFGQRAVCLVVNSCPLLDTWDLYDTDITCDAVSYILLNATKLVRLVVRFKLRKLEAMRAMLQQHVWILKPHLNPIWMKTTAGTVKIACISLGSKTHGCNTLVNECSTLFILSALHIKASGIWHLLSPPPPTILVSMSLDYSNLPSYDHCFDLRNVYHDLQFFSSPTVIYFDHSMRIWSLRSLWAAFYSKKSTPDQQHFICF